MFSMTFDSSSRALSAYLRRYLAENHISCRDWVREIPEPMFRQLVEDSLLRVLAMFAPFIIAMLLTAGKDDVLITFVVCLAIVAIPALWNWHKLCTHCVEREFTYRRLFGKWRWEQ